MWNIQIKLNPKFLNIVLLIAFIVTLILCYWQLSLNNQLIDIIEKQDLLINDLADMLNLTMPGNDTTIY